MSSFKIVGIAAEYNPFHSGHKYQISKTDGDAVVAVMSGPFVQRGDIAVADKWTRAKYAVMGGVDLVVELPVVFALNTAQKFALGAVSLLDSMGADEICFGSEHGELAPLMKAAELMENEPQEISERIRKFIVSGMSYPAAREKAYVDYLPDGILSSPNNILGIEYLRAIIRLKSSIVPTTIKRYGSEYNDTAPRETGASASAIRTLLQNGGDVSKFTEFSEKPYDLSRLDGAVISNLRMMSPETLRSINEVGEGLENRILKAAMDCNTIEAAAEQIKTKRYTMSRVRRILISSLLGLRADMSNHMPDYIRVLAMNDMGKTALREIKKRTELPIIIKTADYKENSPLFNFDVRATDIAALCSDNTAGGADYLKSPVII